MTLLTRIHSVFVANAHHAVDGLEDPEKMVKQSVRQLDETIRNARRAVVRAVGSEKQLSARVEQHRGQRDKLTASAEAAVAAGRDELARSILSQRVELDRTITELETVAGTAAETSVSLRNRLDELVKRRTEAVRRRDILAARQRAASARSALSRSLPLASDIETAAETFERMEERVVRMEAESMAEWEVLDGRTCPQKEADHLAVDAQVDDALAELKARTATKSDG